ncbi:MAG: serine/threonine protein kinase [Acidobacteria bacterium]|nr:serine/threonine protein kinase [Acidobacteriota bacterium]
MRPERWQQVKEIFHSALALPRDERESFLAAACHGQDSLRRDVESLISSHEKTGSFLDAPAYEAAARIMADEKKALQDREALGSYKIISALGAGGMGEVYLAHDQRLNRNVALKVLPADLINDRERLHRFEQEAQAASALNHPNVITIYEIGNCGDTHFIATEFIEGQTLGRMLQTKRAEVAEALSIATQIAASLDAAHRRGIVHRDIKPENVMLREDGLVKVLDFGLAKLTGKGTDAPVDTEARTRQQVRTMPGMMMGTARYMSPEQARGQEVDARTDVWSLGVVLYEMLSGMPPFPGETMSDTISAILSKNPLPLSAYCPDIPKELERLVNKTLRKDREERYQTAKDLLIDLKDVKQDLEFQNKSGRAAAPDLEEAKTKVFNATTSDIAPHTTSSAASVVNSFTHHKRSALLGLLSLTIASIALFFFLNRSPVLTEKDTILLADFVNTTGDPVFDLTLKQALAVQLGQTPFLNIYPDDRIQETLRLMNRKPDERITKDVAREICERNGIKAMLLGSVANLGNNYVITLEALNPRTGEALAREQIEAAGKEQVLGKLGDAATKLRGKLGESLQSIEKFDASIEQATTSSLAPSVPGRFEPKTIVSPSQESVARVSFAALLTAVRLTGAAQSSSVLPRTAVQMSWPPRPPGRFEAMKRLCPSGDWIGQPSLNGVLSCALVPGIDSALTGAPHSPKCLAEASGAKISAATQPADTRPGTSGNLFTFFGDLIILGTFLS